MGEYGYNYPPSFYGICAAAKQGSCEEGVNLTSHEIALK